MRPSTLALLERAAIRPGITCLEAGCGGGDVAFDIARMVTPGGRVIATDIDETKLELARSEVAGFLIRQPRWSECVKRSVRRSHRDRGYDFSGYFCQPDNAAFRRYMELYTGIARRRGGEANIGPRLPALLGAAGFVDIEVTVVQHVSLTGEVKLLPR